MQDTNELQHDGINHNYSQPLQYVPPTPQAVPNGVPNGMNNQGYPSSYQNTQTVPVRTTTEFSETTLKRPNRKSVTSKFIDTVYVVLIIVESVLGLRFIFKLLGANPENIFASILYAMTEVFTLPFVGLFGVDLQNSIRVSGYQLEFTTLVAMGVYALVAYVIVRLIELFR